MSRRVARVSGRAAVAVALVVAAGLAGAAVHAVLAAGGPRITPQSGSQITLVKTMGGGSAYSGQNDNGDEVGISSGESQTWSTMILPGFGQGSCCPSNVPARVSVVVPPGTHAFFRVTLSGQVACMPNGSVTNEAGCFVRVLVGGHFMAPDPVVFVRAQPRGPSANFSESHAAQFVSDPLPAGRYPLVVQWSTLEASFVSDQFMIMVDRVQTAA